MWIFEGFTPTAKLANGKSYSIITDHIGRPIRSIDDNGELVWSADYDIYGRLKNVKGERTFIPFRQVGQIEDSELEGLYYNRYRWYNSETGCYISQDPIGLAGNNPTLYAYVHDSNSWVDVFGLNVFWSGGSNAKIAAEQFAKNNHGRTTLEMTPRGYLLEDLTNEKFSSGEWTNANWETKGKPVWKQASSDFAYNAVKDYKLGKITHVDVFIDSSKYQKKKKYLE
ncbi:hypothetical protein HMPREF1528_01814 [Capnocytophaga sp. oral taxon 336 str. F0502]|nr:hypothetical protein HMPREF1528_01814 [Capnocytophaga sp. oral taxon 336 str. F0502]